MQLRIANQRETPYHWLVFHRHFFGVLPKAAEIRPIKLDAGNTDARKR